MSTALENFRNAPVQECNLNGTLLRYRSFGSGPAVVLVHGWPLSGVTYRHLIEALQPYYRCYVPDLPGAGSTPWSANIRESSSGYAEVLRAFVDRLQLERFAFVAHDSGGGAARLAAAELGARVACLILQNTELPAHMPMMVKLFKLGSDSPAIIRVMQRMLASPTLRRSAVGFGGCFGDRSLIDGEFAEACVQPLLENISGHIDMLAHLDLKMVDRLPDAHARITAPIHLFWGADDGFFPLPGARKMAATFKRPGAFEVVPNAKLYVHEEAPTQLAAFSLPLLAQAFGDARVAKEPRANVQS